MHILGAPHPSASPLTTLDHPMVFVLAWCPFRPLPPPISSPLVLDKTGRTSRMVGKMQPPGCHWTYEIVMMVVQSHWFCWRQCTYDFQHFWAIPIHPEGLWILRNTSCAVLGSSQIATFFVLPMNGPWPECGAEGRSRAQGLTVQLNLDIMGATWIWVKSLVPQVP